MTRKPSKGVRNIDAIISYFATRHVDDLGPGLAIALTDRISDIDTLYQGVADVRTGSTIDPDTRFQIGSITKTITAAAILRVVEQGGLDLHAPVTETLDWLDVGEGTERITAHHLLTHTSGMVFLIDTIPSSRLAVWQLRHTNLGFEPGTRFSYSNMGYMVLGHLLESATAQTYPRAIEELVFEPLGMDDSVAGISPEVPMAVGHERMQEARHRWAAIGPLELDGGHAGVLASASDLTRLLRMVLNRGRSDTSSFLTAESIAMMTSGGFESGWPGYRYSCGMFAGEMSGLDGHRIIHNAGENPGFQSAMLGDLDAGLGVVALCNSWASPWADAAYALSAMQSSNAPRPRRQERHDRLDDPPVGEHVTSPLVPYVGRYLAHAPMMNEHRIIGRSDGLHVWRPGLGSALLTMVDTHEFRVGAVGSPERVVFSCFVNGRAQQSTLGGGVYARVDVTGHSSSNDGAL